MTKVKIVGGCAFHEDELVKAYENPEKNKYTVEMKDGTTIIYPMQEYEREAEVRKTPEGRVDFKGLKDAVIIDTPKNDVYRLMGCCNVLVNADNSKDSDWVQIINRRLSTGKMQMSENNRICLNKNDLYSLPGSQDMSFVDKDTNIDA